MYVLCSVTLQAYEEEVAKAEEESDDDEDSDEEDCDKDANVDDDGKGIHFTGSISARGRNVDNG